MSPCRGTVGHAPEGGAGVKRNGGGVLLELQECILALPTVSVSPTLALSPTPCCPSRKALSHCLTASRSLPRAVSPSPAVSPHPCPMVVSPHVTMFLQS